MFIVPAGVVAPQYFQEVEQFIQLYLSLPVATQTIFLSTADPSLARLVTTLQTMKTSELPLNPIPTFLHLCHLLRNGAPFDGELFPGMKVFMQSDVMNVMIKIHQLGLTASEHVERVILMEPNVFLALHSFLEGYQLLDVEIFLAILSDFKQAKKILDILNIARGITFDKNLVIAIVQKCAIFEDRIITSAFSILIRHRALTRDNLSAILQSEHRQHLARSLITFEHAKLFTQLHARERISALFNMSLEELRRDYCILRAIYMSKKTEAQKEADVRIAYSVENKIALESIIRLLEPRHMPSETIGIILRAGNHEVLLNRLKWIGNDVALDIDNLSRICTSSAPAVTPVLRNEYDQKEKLIDSLFHLFSRHSLFSDADAQKNFNVLINYRTNVLKVLNFRADPHFLEIFEEKMIRMLPHVTEKLQVIFGTDDLVSLPNVSTLSRRIEAIDLLLSVYLFDSQQRDVFKNQNPLECARALQLAVKKGVFELPDFQSTQLAVMYATDYPLSFLKAYSLYTESELKWSDQTSSKPLSFDQFSHRADMEYSVEAAVCLQKAGLLIREHFDCIVKSESIARAVIILYHAGVLNHQWLEHVCHHIDPIDLANALVQINALSLEPLKHEALVADVLKKGVLLLHYRDVCNPEAILEKTKGCSAYVWSGKERVFFHIDRMGGRTNIQHKKSLYEDLRALFPDGRKNQTKPFNLASKDSLVTLRRISTCAKRLPIDLCSHYVESFACSMDSELALEDFEKNDNPSQLKDALNFLKSESTFQNKLIASKVYHDLIIKHPRPREYLKALYALEQKGLLDKILHSPTEYDPASGLLQRDPMLYAELHLFLHHHGVQWGKRDFSAYKKIVSWGGEIYDGSPANILLKVLNFIVAEGIPIDSKIIAAVRDSNISFFEGEAFDLIKKLLINPVVIPYKKEVILELLKTTNDIELIDLAEAFELCVHAGIFKQEQGIATQCIKALNAVLKGIRRSFGWKPHQLFLFDLFKINEEVFSRLLLLLSEKHENDFLILTLLKREGLLNGDTIFRLLSRDINCPLKLFYHQISQAGFLNQRVLSFLLDHGALFDENFITIWGNVPPHLFTEELLIRLMLCCEQHHQNPVRFLRQIRLLVDDVLGIRQQAMNTVVANRQNTHTASVHRTVSESAIRLRDAFTQEMQTERLNGLSTELFELIMRQEDSLRHAYAKRYFQHYIMRSMFVDPLSQVSLKSLVLLFFLALKTTGTFNQEEQVAHLMTTLHELQRDGNIDQHDRDNGDANDKPSCLSGAFNKFVYKLQGIHPAVQVAVVDKASAAEKLGFLTRKLMHEGLKQALSERERIFPSLDAFLDEKQEEIWRQVKRQLLQELSSEFGSLFTKPGELTTFVDAGQDFEFTKEQLSELSQLFAVVPAGQKRRERDEDDSEPVAKEPRVGGPAFFSAQPRSRREGSPDEQPGAAAADSPAPGL